MLRTADDKVDDNAQCNNNSINQLTYEQFTSDLRDDSSARDINLDSFRGLEVFI